MHFYQKYQYDIWVNMTPISPLSPSPLWQKLIFHPSLKAHFHSRKNSENVIVIKSQIFFRPTMKFFVSANHILQNFLSAEYFPEQKWVLSGRKMKPYSLL
jgi:hypothetical protein